MEKLTGKRAQRYIEMYERCNNGTLSTTYRTWSNAKYRAYMECVDIAIRKHAIRNDGLYWKIISHNTMQFTFAFVNGDGLHVITKCHHYVIEYLPF